ncbi:pentatricopeptide repeat-containing protein At3g04760, chloroplastic-like [Asparagus officinalis]|uniref:pentatricopeptide repeat-containing protein At3g04760, chloroplastic-like n=1 Tax=Asparagus officinalis TaxID=4686 RepID=UPI00098E132C|nr:pentatricopeptide repeat-containing protein At3g04760, chloroplastic-like [Asparagus officinalis]XP_020267360.1 pentatricopeptide repeat-containing protein At3g04760, chloroplastic-like [Asparagus officinalis]XP_020267361.1 pentatricopeptide repeat-containing protein At3g04760, chloroplastic-like [Asparagus officinalis]
MCNEIKRSFVSNAGLLRDSSDEDENRISSLKPVKDLGGDGDITSRFSNAVANLFRLHQGCHDEAKVSTVLPEEKKITSDEEVDSFGETHLSVKEIDAERNRWRPPSAYNKMMKALTVAGKVNEVVRLLQEMKQSDCKPNVLCYNTVMNAFVKANRPREARVVFKEIITSGISPNVSSYNILVKMYCRSRQLDLAYKVIESMMKCGYKPDSTTYSILIMGICQVGRVDEAWNIFEYMVKNNCSPTAHTYTPIVHSYCLEGKIQDAKIVLDIMEDSGCPPSFVTYNVLIDGLCKVGDFDAVKEIIKESELKEWKPNSTTYTVYMNGLCKGGKLKEAIDVLETMRAKGLEPTDVSLGIYIDCLCCDSRIWEAKCVLDESTELKLCVGVISYNTLMARLSEIGRWLEVLNLFTNMLKKGIAPNTRTFNIVINSLGKGGKLLKAKFMFNSRRFVANNVTYNTLIHWCLQNGEIDEAQLLFSRMNVEKIDPDIITCTIMVVGLCKAKKFSEATNCFLGSLPGNFEKDLVNGLIKKLHEGRRFKEIRYLYEEMRILLIERFRRSHESIFLEEIYEEIQNVCIDLGKMLGKQ